MNHPKLWQTFPCLPQSPKFAHAFTLRHPEIDVKADRETALKRLSIWHRSVAEEIGFPPARLVTAQQVHGNNVAVVRTADESIISSVDGLISDQPDLVLGIYVADCCAVYLVDHVGGAFGLLHSGKKGTELGITTRAIELMSREFRTAAENLTVLLSPCIRPPAYEIDFAAMIREQACATGVLPHNIHDDGTCTSSDLDRFYSYRMEKGKTGRMLALLGRLSSNGPTTA